MLALRRQLRAFRWVALLAIFLSAGMAPHAHAMLADAPHAVSAQAPIQDDDGPAPSDGIHCGLCHVARGVMPSAASVPAPPAMTRRGMLIPDSRAMALLAMDVPIPPPRPAGIA